MEVEIDFRKSAQENAARYFEEAKRAKEKLAATERALQETERKIEEAKKKQEEERKNIEKPKKKARGRWYNKFRWSLTTEGFLVIGGRDATQNEMIFKKHIQAGDVVLHADIKGAPLTVIKRENKAITPLALREAGEFAGAYSSAWKAGLGAVDVYWVTPEQVSKTPESGEFLPKGAFMIRGKKEFLRRLELKIAIGIKIEKDEEGQEQAAVICGSVQSVNNGAKYFVTLKPGSLPQNEATKEVKRRLLMKAYPYDKASIEAVPVEELQRVVPTGNSDVIG